MQMHGCNSNNYANCRVDCIENYWGFNPLHFTFKQVEYSAVVQRVAERAELAATPNKDAKEVRPVCRIRIHGSSGSGFGIRIRNTG